MSVIRVLFAKRFKNANINGVSINTVHDSIVVDVADNDVAKTVTLFREVFRDVPKNINKIFNIGFDLAIKCEIEVGHNQCDMEEV